MLYVDWTGIRIPTYLMLLNIKKIFEVQLQIHDVKQVNKCNNVDFLLKYLDRQISVLQNDVTLNVCVCNIKLNIIVDRLRVKACLRRLKINKTN